jgi:CRP-like cAMP-binding protein
VDGGLGSALGLPAHRSSADHTYELPVTQAELGDALGLSTVHVNRTVQELRAAGLISMKGATVKVLDWERLKETGEFDPTYLHQDWDAA